MTSRSANVIVLAVAATAAALGAGQSRDPSGAAPQGLAGSGTAILSGSVHTATMPPEPVRHAIVRLTHVAGGSARLVGTDADGRFVFTALPAGSYQLSAMKVGYVPAVFGARRPGRAGVPVALTEGQRVDVSLAMTRGAVVTGRIVDPHGAPAAMVPVTAVEVRPSGTAPTPVRATTDDRGVYRIFGLPPGDYVVSALPRLGIGRSSVTGDILAISDAEGEWIRRQQTAGVMPQGSMPRPGTRVVYAPVFYPGTARADGAAVMSVAAADERSGVDFALAVVPTARISGTLLDDAGQPITGPASISLYPRRGDRHAVTDALIASRALVLPAAVVDGSSFTIGGVVPGDYTLVARTGAAGRRGSAPGPASPATLWNLTDISIDGQDQTGMVLRLQPGAAISGTIAIEGTSKPGPEDAMRAAVRMVAMDPLIGGPAASNAVVNADGTFRFSSVVPGAHALDATLPGSPRWMLASATLQGRDIADDVLDLRAGEHISNLLLTFSNRSAGIRGRLVDAAGQAVTRYTIVVFTVNRAWWRPYARRIRSTIPATDGWFEIAGLPAGDYAVAAVDDLEPSDLGDSSFLSRLLAAALQVSLEAGETKVQDLRVGGGPELRRQRYSGRRSSATVVHGHSQEARR
jgi:hypothetical protein